MNSNCDCNVSAASFTVKKEGPNKGRKFFTCKEKKCKYFFFADGKGNYKNFNFKGGACSRCGRYGCDVTTCDNETDFYGNTIPENWNE